MSKESYYQMETDAAQSLLQQHRKNLPKYNFFSSGDNIPKGYMLVSPAFTQFMFVGLSLATHEASIFNGLASLIATGALVFSLDEIYRRRNHNNSIDAFIRSEFHGIDPGKN